MHALAGADDVQTYIVRERSIAEVLDAVGKGLNGYQWTDDDHGVAERRDGDNFGRLWSNADWPTGARLGVRPRAMELGTAREVLAMAVSHDGGKPADHTWQLTIDLAGGERVEWAATGELVEELWHALYDLNDELNFPVFELTA